MSVISDDDKERVRQATDFVELVGETVELRQKGADFWGCCPFHHEKTPSFKVNPSTGLYHCFGCGLGGDVFNYVQQRENLEFIDALRYLADRAGIELSETKMVRGPKKSRLTEALAEAAEFYHQQLTRSPDPAATEARKYLSSRGFGLELSRRWKLGFAPGHGQLVRYLRDKGFTNQELLKADLASIRQGSSQINDRFYDRVMFPISDELGRIIAFGGRVLGSADHVAKYLNTRDTPVFNKGKQLFAYDRAKEAIAAAAYAIVCEGYTDVIALHEAGFKMTVAALGTAFRLDHVRLLERQRPDRIYCLFDGDAAGQRAAERAVSYIDKTTAALLCVVLPNNQDPMEFISEHGADALKAELEQAIPLMDFVVEKRLQSYDLTIPGRRVAALDDIARVLAPLKKSLLLDDYVLQIADRLRFNAEQVRAAIMRARPLPSEEGTQRSMAASPIASPPQMLPSRAENTAEKNSVTSMSNTARSMDRAIDSMQARYAAEKNSDERRQHEREIKLLCLMHAYPQLRDEVQARLSSLEWIDERNKAIAWAFLSLPSNASSIDLLAVAVKVYDNAAALLSQDATCPVDLNSAQTELSVLLNSFEFFSAQQKLKEIEMKIRRLAATPADKQSPQELTQQTQLLLKEASELQQRMRELQEALSRIS